MKEELYADVGLRIQRIRERKGYTREALAELAEISTKFLYEIETGKKGFTVIVLYRISKVLNVNCDYILTGGHEQGNYNKELLERIELFDEEQMEKLIRLLDVVYEFWE